MPAVSCCRLALLLLLSSGAWQSAPALICYGSGPTDVRNTLNTTAPANGAPWAYVARFGANNASGIYLGNGFVLTANHVTVVDDGFVIDGVNYQRDTSFQPLQVTENSAATAYADVVDLKLVRILANPTWPALSKLAINDSATADLGKASTMIGWGVGKGAIVSDQGWNWGDDGTRAQRWGSNTTLAASETVSYSGYQYEGLDTSFRRSLGADTGQLTLGDSGGGLFQLQGRVWKLSGIMTATAGPQSSAALFDGLYPTPPGDQPDGATYVRLARYAHLLRYENWASMYLGSSTADENGDGDGDGVANLLEYAFHTDPTSAASFSLPQVGAEPGFITLIYTKLMSATDLIYAIESATDLLLGDWEASGATEEVVSSSGMAWTIKARVPVAEGARQFLRMRVTRVP